MSADNSKLSIDARPFSDGKVIPLGIKSSYLQDFIIKAQNVAVPDNGQVYLHDKYLQTYTQLLQGTEYKFTITKDAASQGDNRFELSMKKAGTQYAGCDDREKTGERERRHTHETHQRTDLEIEISP